MEKELIGVYSLLIILAEVLVRFNSSFGAFIYFFLISCSVVFLSERNIPREYYNLFIILTIIPLVRVLCLFVDLGYIYRLVVVYFILLFLSIYYSKKFSIPIGFRKENLWFLPFVIIIGGLLGFVGSSFIGFKEGLLFWILPLIAVSEEIYFRGLLQNSIEKTLNVIYSFILPAVLYLVLVFGFGGFGAIFLLGIFVFSSIIYHNTRNIWLCIVLNIVSNYFLFVF
jgi:membrane protease YdiL (CAAX protease family)